MRVGVKKVAADHTNTLDLAIVHLLRCCMLFADKRKLETGLKVKLNAIREKELNYYVRCRFLDNQCMPRFTRHLM